jgi:alginate O-acetyltransferase complex protein AlgI
MLVSIGFNWYLALAMNRSRYRGGILAAGVFLNLTSIAIFKYGEFILSNLPQILVPVVSIPKIALPIGISFYTFQAISYLVDTYRGDIQPQKNPLYFGCYLSMFPQLIAGPIVRYKTISHEITARKENQQDFAAGMSRFLLGLGKKVLIANTMGLIADRILSIEPSYVGMIPAWYAFIAYSLQIYFDFSGYSDMAIGLGQMLGFHFIENFNYPYVAKSITEFWRRWHISLSSFFKDYVYIPLGGNRVIKSRWLINLAVVWSLTGLWHGASWNFVCWGVYYGILLICEKVLWGKWLKRLHFSIQHLYTIIFIIIGWVIFRIENFELLIEWIKSMFGFHGIGHPITLNALNILHYYPWIIIGIIGSTPIFIKLMKTVESSSILLWLREVCTVGIFLWCIVELSTSGFNPFIYFKF